MSDSPALADAPSATTFPEAPKGASASRVAAPPSEFWNIHGMCYRLPPLFDQLATAGAAEAPGFKTYAQWVASTRAPAARPDGAAKSAPKPAQRPIGLPPGFVLPFSEEEDRQVDEVREELERRARAYGTVVRRDILRQQRAIIAQQREMLQHHKRASLAAQKQVRVPALKAQRAAQTSQVLVRVKHLTKGLAAVAKTRELVLEERWRHAEKEQYFERRANGAAPPTPGRSAATPAKLAGSGVVALFGGGGAAGGGGAPAVLPRPQGRRPAPAAPVAAASPAERLSFKRVTVRLKGAGAIGGRHSFA